MRNLNLINQAARSTGHVFAISLVIPFFLGWIAWTLATAATNGVTTNNNILSSIGIGFSLAAIVALPAPFVFGWDWEVKYFGACTFALASGALIGLFPIACIICYGSIGFCLKFSIVLFETAMIIWWCSRFVIVYQKIFENKKYFEKIYEEDLDVIYYVRRAETMILQSNLKFVQIPQNKFFVISTAAAIILIPFAASVSKIFGLPFIHIFIAVISTPINLMFLGLGMKGVLAFYIYPNRVRKLKHKPIYIDISSAPRKAVN